MTTTTTSTPSSFEEEVERNYRHNFVFNALDGASFWLGYSFISPAIILPLYVSRFTDSPLVIALITFFNTAFFLLPQLFTTNWISRAPRKKIFPAGWGFFGERLPIFLMAPSALLFARSQPDLALFLILFLFAWHCLGAGTIIVGWQDMIAKIIPVDRRGRFFGITNFAGNATGILGALAVGWVLEHYEFPNGYVLSFGAAGVLIFLSWIFLSQTREPAQPPTRPPVSQREYLGSLPSVVRADANFSRFLFAQIVLSLSMLGVGFLAVYPAERWALPDSLAGGLSIAMLSGQSLANLAFGWLSDRRGHKLVLEIGAVSSVAAFALALLAPNPVWFYAVFFLRGVNMASFLLSGLSIGMEFSSPEDRPTYIALTNTVPGIASSAAPLLGGWLATGAGYPPVFAISAVIALVGIGLLHWGVRDPRFAGRAPLTEKPAQEMVEP